MSLNTNLFEITKYQKDNDFFGSFEVKRTFYHTEIMPSAIIIVNEKNGKCRSIRQPESNENVVTPCSLQSLARSAGHLYPHALHDKLKYLSKGLEKDETLYAAYVDILRKWAGFSHDARISALLRYVEGGTIAQDLKKYGYEIDKDMCVAFEFYCGGQVVSPWLDEVLIDSYIDFYDYVISERVEGNVCAITGSDEIYSHSYPKRLCRIKGKYLSEFDESGTAWHGWAHSPEDVVAISARANYYIYWALDHIIHFHSYHLYYRNEKKDPNKLDKHTYYALTGVKSTIQMPLSMSFNSVAHLYGLTGGDYKDFDIVEQKMREGVQKDTVLLFLGVRQMSTGKLGIKSYQEYYWKDVGETIRNYIRWHRTTSLVRTVTYMSPVTEDNSDSEEEPAKQKFEKVAFDLIMLPSPSITEIVNQIYHVKADDTLIERLCANDFDFQEELIDSLINGRVATPLRWRFEDSNIVSFLNVRNSSTFIKKLNCINAVNRVIWNYNNGNTESTEYGEAFYGGRLCALCDTIYLLKNKEDHVTPFELLLLSDEFEKTDLKKQLKADIKLFQEKGSEYLEQEFALIEKELIKREIEAKKKKHIVKESLKERLMGYQYEMYKVKGELWRNYSIKFVFI